MLTPLRTHIHSPLIHGRIVDSQATENRESLKNGNFTVGELSPVGVYINQNANYTLLAVNNRHAQDALGLMRDVRAVAAVLGVTAKPLGGVVDVEYVAILRDVLSNLSEDRAVYVLDRWTINVGHAIASLQG